VSVVIVGVIRRKPVLTHASIVCEGMLASVNSVNSVNVTWGVVEAAPSCALFGGFAIGARIALLWQHNANRSHKLASIPRYDDIVRTLSGVCARCWPSTGAF